MKTVYLFAAAISFSFFAHSQKLPEYIKDADLEIKSPGKALLNELVFIPGGTFTMLGDGNLSPSYLVSIQSYYIQKSEVTNLWYKRFLYDIAKTDPSKVLSLLPDTLSWVKDFNYSFNETLVLNYFQNMAYNNYPVVGLDYLKVTAFSEWANTKVKEYVNTLPVSKQIYGEVRIPMASEWQYAASGGLDKTCYGFDNKDKWLNDCGVFGLYDAQKRLFRANYKTDEYNYISDRCFHTCPVMSYAPNPYGLYDMVGNVSEWVSDTFVNFIKKDTNPIEWDSESQPGYLILKGGSWADGYKDQFISRRKSIHADSSYSYVGFRLAVSVKQ